MMTSGLRSDLAVLPPVPGRERMGVPSFFV
jgi:hypothetical protein